MEQLTALQGPAAAPGRYAVRLTVDGVDQRAEFELTRDPRIPATDADLAAQFALQRRLRDLLDRTHRGVDRLRAARSDPKITAATKRTLDAIEGELMQPKAKSRQDILNFGVRLNNRVAAVIGAVGSADAAPTKQAAELAAVLEKEVDAQLAKLDRVLGRGKSRVGR